MPAQDSVNRPLTARSNVSPGYFAAAGIRLDAGAGNIPKEITCVSWSFLADVFLVHEPAERSPLLTPVEKLAQPAWRTRHHHIRELFRDNCENDFNRLLRAGADLDIHCSRLIPETPDAERERAGTEPSEIETPSTVGCGGPARGARRPTN